MFFTDKKNREIKLNESLNTIYAYHNNSKIGYIQFATYEFPDGYDTIIVAYPEIMNVEHEFQRSGIATQMIKYAISLGIYDKVCFASALNCCEDKNVIHYSKEGASFKDYCEKNGITFPVH